MILEGGRTFLDDFRAEIPHQQKSLICMYGNSDVFHFSLVKDMADALVVSLFHPATL
jgi:hypothetical protein